ELVCYFKSEVRFENVRVPASCLIGGETDGWKVAGSTLEVEHGGRGNPTGGGGGWSHTLDDLIDYCSATARDGGPLFEDPEVAQKVADLYVQGQIGRLWRIRNYWMRMAGVPSSYEGSQATLHAKTFVPGLAQAILDIVGPYALLNDRRWAPRYGRFE